MEEPEERIGDAGGMEVAGDVQDRDDDGSSSSDSDTELQQQITDLEATVYCKHSRFECILSACTIA